MGSYRKYERDRDRAEADAAMRRHYAKTYEDKQAGVKPYDPEMESWVKRLGPAWGPAALWAIRIALVVAFGFFLAFMFGTLGHPGPHF